MCSTGAQGPQGHQVEGEVTQLTAVAVENILVKNGAELRIGETGRIELQMLQRTQRAWHELESAVKRACAPKPLDGGGFGPRLKLTADDVELCEAIVLGEGSAPQNGWRECKQALEQAGLI